MAGVTSSLHPRTIRLQQTFHFAIWKRNFFSKFNDLCSFVDGFSNKSKVYRFCYFCCRDISVAARLGATVPMHNQSEIKQRRSNQDLLRHFSVAPWRCDPSAAKCKEAILHACRSYSPQDKKPTIQDVANGQTGNHANDQNLPSAINSPGANMHRLFLAIPYTKESAQ